MSEQLDKLLEQRSEWTLWQDSMLRQYLEGATENILKNIKNVEATVNELDNEAELLSLRIENVHNNIDVLKSSKLIEERIVDVPFEEKKDADIKNEEHLSEEQKTTNAIRKALEIGFELVDKSFKELTLVSPDFFTEIDPTFTPQPIFEVRNPYANRPLPSLIGSAEFYASTTAYLKDEITPDDEKQVVESITVNFPHTGRQSTNDTQSGNEVLFYNHPSNINEPSGRERDTLKTCNQASQNETPSSSRNSTNESEDFISSIPQSSIPTQINQHAKKQIDSHCEADISTTQNFLTKILRSTVSSANIVTSSAELAKENKVFDNKNIISEPVNEFKSSTQIKDKPPADSFSANQPKATPISQPELPAHKIPFSGRKFEDSISANTAVSATNSSSAYLHRPSKQKILSSKSGKIRSQKGLFSSSSSSLSSEEEQQKVPEEKRLEGQETVESAVQESDEMPKPVLKAFDANFSDRLAAALKNKQPAMRRRNAPENVNDEIARTTTVTTSKPPPAPLPTPSSTAVMARAKGPARRAPTNARKPQQTASIPISSKDTESGNTANKSPNTNFSQTSVNDLTKSSVSEIVKTMPKPDEKLQSTPKQNSSTVEKKIEPPSKKDIVSTAKFSKELLTAKSLSEAKNLHLKTGEKTQKKSIFDSSTSDEDDFLTKSSKNKTVQINTNKAKEIQPRAVNVKSQEQNLSSTSKSKDSRATTSKELPKKKGLFDDSDSDI